MKELTHEEWMKDPTPRVMWVWDSDEADKKQLKVVYISKKDMTYPVVTLANDDAIESKYKHCAEIGKTRRMTNKELARWLRLNPTREFIYKNGNYVYSHLDYEIICENKEVSEYIKIRENDGEWREPIIEE